VFELAVELGASCDEDVMVVLLDDVCGLFDVERLVVVDVTSRRSTTIDLAARSSWFRLPPSS